jgi:2-oxoglutarate dehydrogenase E2 component (dihydrolipoamide succinyltransferase)
MKHELKVPPIGESVSEAHILKWRKNTGVRVQAGEVLVELESDKATVELVSEDGGVLTIERQAGERVRVGEVLAWVEDSVEGAEAPGSPIATPPPFSPRRAQAGPAARKLMAEAGVAQSSVQGTGKDGRITKGDVLGSESTKSPDGESAEATPARPVAAAESSVPRGPALKEGERRVPLSAIRLRIAERLVEVQRTAAILTTFNEIDLTSVLELRSKHAEAFKARTGASLGFVSFFARASIEALKRQPIVNAFIDGHDIVYHDYYDLGIAVSTDRGLVVPVLRDVGEKSIPELETLIAALAAKAREGKLSVEELSGGTFTISNGGVYGSLLSTPILNPPQSAILGLHQVQDRPVARDGKVEIRPMMYVALSYDHRLIDGKEAVTFLAAIKELIENPERLGAALPSPDKEW